MTAGFPGVPGAYRGQVPGLCQTPGQAALCSELSGCRRHLERRRPTRHRIHGRGPRHLDRTGGTKTLRYLSDYIIPECVFMETSIRNVRFK